MTSREQEARPSTSKVQTGAKNDLEVMIWGATCLTVPSPETVVYTVSVVDAYTAAPTMATTRRFRVRGDQPRGGIGAN